MRMTGMDGILSACVAPIFMRANKPQSREPWSAMIDALLKNGVRRRYRKDWRGWHYYASAYAIVVALYVTPFALIYGLRGR